METGYYSSIRNAQGCLYPYFYTVAGNPRESYIDGIWNKALKVVLLAVTVFHINAFKNKIHGIFLVETRNRETTVQR